jgi:beta-lactamase class A
MTALDAGDPASTAAGTDPLAARVEALLAPLGGRTAAAARALGHPPGIAGAAAMSDERELALRASEELAAASLAKVPIAVELARRVDLGAFSLDERIDLAGIALVGGGGVLDALAASDEPGAPNAFWLPTLGDLAALMLGVSDNTAANVLLDQVGMGEVNETMARLGFGRTRLARRFMDFAARAAGRENVTTAGDMAALMALLARGAVPLASRVRGWLVADPLNDAVTLGLPPDAGVANKPGTLPGIINSAGILSGPGGECAYCVLTAEQDDMPAAATAVARVVRALWDAWCAPL